MTTTDPRTSFHLFGFGDDDSNKESSSKRIGEILNADDDAAEREDSLDVIHHESSTDENTKKASSSSPPWESIISTILGVTTNNTSSTNDQNAGIEKVVESARNYVTSSGQSNSKSAVKTDNNHESWELMEKELKLVAGQLDSSFSHLSSYDFNPMALGYYLEQEDAKKNPSWKRRIHRFQEALNVDTIEALHDALYLAELSYCDSVEDITAGIAAYQGAPYELIYCTTEALPRQPAHFLCLKKESKKNKKDDGGFSLPFLQKEPDPLEVLLVVRGTKEITDALSDALLVSRDFRGGKAHDGICQSGTWLVEKHTPLLELLMKESGRKKIKLQLVGHSLGAGAAAIACLEWNDHKAIEAQCVGFGCPALLTKENAEACAGNITTVVSDSDCVPRLSKVTVSNLLLDVMSYDFCDSATRDVEQLVTEIGKNVPFDFPKEKQTEVVTWVKDNMVKKVLPDVEKIPKERQEIELMPPGKCIHLYRDGSGGLSATYAPNDFFNEIDVCLTMVDDHYISTGYHRNMLDLMRAHFKHTRWDFRHDLLALRVEKPEPAADDDDEKKE